jgi:hypothetical protein
MQVDFKIMCYPGPRHPGYAGVKPFLPKPVYETVHQGVTSAQITAECVLDLIKENYYSKAVVCDYNGCKTYELPRDKIPWRDLWIRDHSAR